MRGERIDGEETGRGDERLGGEKTGREENLTKKRRARHSIKDASLSVSLYSI